MEKQTKVNEKQFSSFIFPALLSPVNIEELVMFLRDKEYEKIKLQRLNIEKNMFVEDVHKTKGRKLGQK